MLFEKNWYYYFGYGFIIGIVKSYFTFYNSIYIISCIFPILSMNTLILFKQDNEMMNVKNNNITIPLFYLPIKYANIVIDLLSDYLKK